MSDPKARKRELVHEAGELAGELVTAEEGLAFLDQFYQHVPPADLVERSPRDLCGGALSLWRFAEHRSADCAKIRVYNPDPAQDGWSSPRTIVEIINDDMPFLVDSVTGAINASNRLVHLIIYPILTVSRSPDGRLCDLLDPGAPGPANRGCRSRSRRNWTGPTSPA
jgi:glutamate dehydrogenase